MEIAMERLLFFVLVAVVFQCTQVQISSAVACKFVSGSKCKCTLADGTGEIDLSPLFGGGSTMLSTTADKNKYTYNACGTVPCDNKCPTSEGGCVACQDGGGVNVFGIGSVDSAQLGEVTTSGWTFTISYSNSMQNKKCHVTYKRAASGGTQFNFISESPQSTYNLDVTGCFNVPGTAKCGTTPSPRPGPTSAGGPSTTDISGWPGLLLISLLIVAVALYFAIGMPIMYYVKGARGLEMIPLISFWKDFPFLVKDGVMFTLFAWPCCINIRPQAYSKI